VRRGAAPPSNKRDLVECFADIRVDEFAVMKFDHSEARSAYLCDSVNVHATRQGAGNVRMPKGVEDVIPRIGCKV
jgi:hypothetical protein